MSYWEAHELQKQSFNSLVFVRSATGEYLDGKAYRRHLIVVTQTDDFPSGRSWGENNDQVLINAYLEKYVRTTYHQWPNCLNE